MSEKTSKQKSSDLLNSLDKSPKKTAPEKYASVYVDKSDNDNVSKLVEDMIDNKKPEKKVVGLYLDPDVAEALRKVGEQGGRGAKSKIANDVLRAFFKEKGIL